MILKPVRLLEPEAHSTGQRLSVERCPFGQPGSYWLGLREWLLTLAFESDGGNGDNHAVPPPVAAANVDNDHSTHWSHGQCS